jgi:hypothetical protein
MHRLRCFCAQTTLALEVPKVDLGGQGAAALALQIFAHIVLDGVEHPIRMPSCHLQGVSFSHARIMRCRHRPGICGLIMQFLSMGVFAWLL